MNKLDKSWTIPIMVALILAIPLFGAALYFATRSSPLPANAKASSPLNDRNRMVLVGGVRRPASDLVATSSRKKGDDNVDPGRELKFGTLPTIKPDANLATKQVSAAMKASNSPEQLGPYHEPEKFDVEAFKADPEKYLSKHVPGRVFQSAQPAVGVPVLVHTTKRNHVIQQGESIRLSVKTLPNMPATFTSFDTGIFDNGLTSISVAANEQGVAEANFLGAPGSIGEINVLAASPVAAEQVKFGVWITPPSETSN